MPWFCWCRKFNETCSQKIWLKFCEWLLCLSTKLSFVNTVNTIYCVVFVLRRYNLPFLKNINRLKVQTKFVMYDKFNLSPRWQAFIYDISTKRYVLNDFISCRSTIYISIDSTPKTECTAAYEVTVYHVPTVFTSELPVTRILRICVRRDKLYYIYKSVFIFIFYYFIQG